MDFIYKETENKSLVVDDPIYGKIDIPFPFSKIVRTKEMKRLSGICQTGFSKLEFKNLDKEDRLSHSIGAFHVMSLFLERLEAVLNKFDIKLSQDDKDVALCSMLLHDIGHGPFSHSLERVTKYPHEKRTTDILLGDTEINQVITELFGKKKVKKIASFIAEINDEEDLGKDSFTKLLKSLVSYQIDADRIDYLLRDAYYANVSSAIDLNKIISSVNVVVNNSQEYELLIDKKGLSSIENVLIQRYQMYRDVYLSPISVLGDYIFNSILDRYRDNEELQCLDVSPSFKLLASDYQISNLTDFLKMQDEDFNESFKIISISNLDPVISYLCDFNNVKDYLLINNDVSIEKIKEKLKEIFKNNIIDNTISVTSIKTSTKLYKKEQKLNIQNGNRIMDLTECTNLIQPQETLEDTYTFFNPELLRIELGLSIDEYEKYRVEVNKMIEELNKKPEEFELKYIIDSPSGDVLTKDILLSKIITVFQNNGFSVISTKEKCNNDLYYDTADLDLYKNGGSLRIRKVAQDNSLKIKGTCKMPLEKGEVYSSRSEIEESLPDDSFETFYKKMLEVNAPVEMDKIRRFHIIAAVTRRTDIVLDKNGVRVCLSFDDTSYFNPDYYHSATNDKMIEIEAIGELKNRVILNEIHEFIRESFSSLKINKQSKYERGINSTIKAINDLNPNNNSESIDIASFQKILKR